MVLLNFKSRRIWRGVFAVSFILRVYLALQPSYLHPDEHLQGPQVIANGYFGWAAQAPWEFTEEQPIRSMVPLWLIYGVPMSFFSDNADPVNVLRMLRLGMAVLSWVLTDMAVDRLSGYDSDKLRSLLFVSTSYVTLTYQARTLSNSLETILLLWCLVIIHEFEHTFTTPFDRHADSAILGGLFALGVFNRPTFIGYFILPGFQLLKFFFKHRLTLLSCVASFVVCSAVFICIDTSLYGRDSWVIAPLNNVLYNTQTSNLALHGLHSRWTHVLVNLPQLLGPGLLLITPKLTLTMQAAISGILCLSVFPHQEARFLVPVVPLLCMNMDIQRIRWPRVRNILIVLWLVFNAVLGLLMGTYHQGGIVPALAEIRDLARPSTVIWWKTYPPPLWLLGLTPHQVEFASLTTGLDSLPAVLQAVEIAPTLNDTMTIVDLMGASKDVLEQVMAQASGNAYLVAPVSNALPKFGKPVWVTKKHLSLDDIDLTSLEPGLAIWNLL